MLRIDQDRELALCQDEAGERRTVEIALVQPVAAGDQLLVHAGTAIGAEAGTDSNTPGGEAEEVVR